MKRGNIKVAASLSEHSQNIRRKINTLVSSTKENNNISSECTYYTKTSWFHKHQIKDLSKSHQEKTKIHQQESSFQLFDYKGKEFKFRPRHKEIVVGSVKPFYCSKGSSLMIGFDDETVKNSEIKPHGIQVTRRHSCHCRTLSEDSCKPLLNKTVKIPSKKVPLKIPTININNRLKLNSTNNFAFANNSQRFLTRFLAISDLNAEISEENQQNKELSADLRESSQEPIVVGSKNLVYEIMRIENNSTSLTPSDQQVEYKEQSIQTTFPYEWECLPTFDVKLTLNFKKDNK
ncbi:unnamed protein product [Blepharisma stoltei]|uniref:Uncharacterized protein n=1 Tax=Blepharisma stoltei TaxID=1481888 RepID=A0AAU9J6Q9_9CILI|nr:unnamed protein product [Blepharisma stoltei]